jgi:nucleoside-diphosphate-sugar epimerase
MIIGSGMIANAFLTKTFLPGINIFASGVSNSNEVDPAAFDRESKMLEVYLGESNKLVYFSTCSVLDPELKNSKYVSHKLQMESLIEQKSKNYLILRLPQVVGFTKNSNTLTNFIYESMVKDKSINIWKYATRNLIDLDDVVSAVNYILENKFFENSVINLASPFLTSPIEIVKIFEKILNKNSQLNIEEKGGSYLIDISSVSQIYKDLNLVFNDQYLEKILYKYYGKNSNL